MEERICRWLLMTHDRAGSNQMHLTQHFIAEMLGVRRPSVTVAAGLLQKAGFISYSRGAVTVLDRAGLEDAACECYAIVSRELDTLMRV
jgi:CRP-like cAMP-binding protein